MSPLTIYRESIIFMLMNYQDRLIYLCASALKRRGLEDDLHKGRLSEEIKAIKTKNEAQYFVDLYDEFQEKKIRYPVNQNNLLVAYLLNLVPDFDINEKPVFEFDGDMPDVDVDFHKTIRDYLKEEWAPNAFGPERVCNIGSYNTFGMRSSLIDIAKVYGKSRDEMVAITKYLVDKDEEGDAVTWEDALRLNPALAEFCEANPDIYNAARKLTNRNKSMGKHAAGLIISNKPLGNFVPLVVDRAEQITSAFVEGLNAQELGPLGLVKFDLLVITNLEQIGRICQLVKARHGLDSICALPGQRDWSDTAYLDDAKAIAMANKGDLKCVFQFDSPGIRSLVKQGGVTSFDDLVAYTALYRPGPLGMGMAEKYVKRKKGEEPYTIHPAMESILGNTYGVMAYQEQVMKVLQYIGGVPDSHTEKVRKAISKKKVEIFGKYKEMFLENGAKILVRDCEPEIPKDAKEVVTPLIGLHKDSFEELEREVANYAFYEGMENAYAKSLGYVAYLYKLQYPSKLTKENIHQTAAAANTRFLWDQIEAFAAYGFNKSHAVAYTYVSSRLLWLKAHYPLEFYAGILSCETKEDKIREYKTEAVIHDIPVEPVNISKSNVRFAIIQENEEPSPDDKIYFGLSNIKGVGESNAEKIVQGQPYASLEQFLRFFGTDATVIKPLLGLNLFDEGDPVTLYKYYENFKAAEKNRIDRGKRYQKTLDRYDSELKEILADHDELATFDESNLELWQQLFDEDDIVEEVCRTPGPKYGKVQKKNLNKWKRLKTLWGKRERSIKGYLKKEAEADENPFTFDKFDPTSDDTYIPKELEEIYTSPESAETKYLGFIWNHPLEKSPDYTGCTFSQLRLEMRDGATVGPVEVVVVSHKKRDWKNGKGFNYNIWVEDGNGERQYVTVWANDWERFEEEFTGANLLRIRVQPPTKFGYTLDSPQRHKRHMLPPKERDSRVFVMEWGENNDRRTDN